MRTFLLLSMLLVSSASGYFIGYAASPLGVVVELSAMLLLGVVSYRISPEPTRSRRAIVVFACVLAAGTLTIAMGRVGSRAFVTHATATIESCAPFVDAARLELATRDFFEVRGGLPSPWTAMKATRLRNSEFWMKFQPGSLYGRRGLVYYAGSTWIHDSQMSTIHVTKVRDGWYVY